MVFDQSVFVKSRHRNSGERRRHRPGADRADDSALSGQRARYIRGAAFDSAFRTGGFHLHSSSAAVPSTRWFWAGLALAFSRLIDNSVVVLENIFRHLEMGESPEVAAEKGGKEVRWRCWPLPSPPRSFFFRLTFLYGVSRYLFTSLALTVVFALFASYVVAMTVVPLYCAHFIKPEEAEQSFEEQEGLALESVKKRSIFQRIVQSFNRWFQRMLDKYVIVVNRSILRPVATTLGILGVVLLSFALFPFLGRSYFPRTDPGQFVINIKCPSGTRIELSNQYIAQVEREIRQIVSPKDLDMIVSNIGITPDLSAIYTSNSSMDTAFVQVSLKEGHKIGSYEYMQRVRRKLASEMPELSTYFQAGGLVDAVINQGLPAPIDIQISGNDMEESYAIARQIAMQAKSLKNVSDVLIPQNLRLPGP